MAFSQIVTSVTIINSGLIGYQGISLTDITASTASLIASGSAVEIGGAYFKADSDLTPDASTWSAITIGTTAYLGLIPAGSAGSQTLTAQWFQDEPVWSTSKQGYYATAASIIRIVASAYKGESSEYLSKTILTNKQSQSAIESKIHVVRVEGTATSATIYNWTCPSGVNEVFVTGIAAGQNGENGGEGYAGAGGNSSLGVYKKNLSVIPGTVYAITVGAPGSSATFGSLLTLASGTGYSGGARANSSSAGGSGGAGIFGNGEGNTISPAGAGGAGGGGGGGARHGGSTAYHAGNGGDAGIYGGQNGENKPHSTQGTSYGGTGGKVAGLFLGYGAGGGGGGAGLSSFSINPGLGGKGAPGIIIIEY